MHGLLAHMRRVVAHERGRLSNVVLDVHACCWPGTHCRELQGVGVSACQRTEGSLWQLCSDAFLGHDKSRTLPSLCSSSHSIEAGCTASFLVIIIWPLLCRRACTDATTGRVYYEDLCFALATDGRKI